MATKQQEVVLIDDDNDTEIEFDIDSIGGEPDQNGGGSSSSMTMEASLPKPMERLSEPYVTPFLKKIFDMVEDPETKSIISWSVTKKSFIVWDVDNFCTNLLPTYFKHSNLASFITQLNSYGFRKINSDRYEYANEWFQGGNKHLLKNIKRKHRRNNSQSIHKQKFEKQNDDVQRPSDVDPGTLRLEMELERVKHEHKTLKEEIQKMKQEQENMQIELSTIKERLWRI